MTITATATDLWFLECFTRLAAHYKRPPSLTELAAYCNRSASTTSVVLHRLVMAGMLARAGRRFVLPGAAS